MSDHEAKAREWLQRMDNRFRSETFQPNDVESLAAVLQEAEREALERAAQVADQYPTYRKDNGDKGSRVADEIRALAASQPAEKERASE